METDVANGGWRTLVGFFDANDLLHLSCCCTRMLQYRCHLKNISINFQDKRISGHCKRQLDTLLSKQKDPRTLFIREPRVYANVARYMVDQYKNVQAVSFAPIMRSTISNNFPIFKAMQQHAFERVVCLSFYNSNLSGMKISINQDSCPSLRSLVIDTCYFRSPIHIGLLLTLLPRLLKLSVRACKTTKGDASLISCMGIALKLVDKRPQLRSLELVDLQTCEWDGVWLAEAIETKAFNDLETLRIEHCYLSDPASAVMLNAMAHNCQAIKRLHIDQCGCEEDAMSALTGVIKSKGLPNLCSIIFVNYDDESTRTLINTINETYPKLLWKVV